MRGIEIELWARRVIAAVVAGNHAEDSRVELKREWPKTPEDAARRIAGHCNAAGGGDALWIIGVDETQGPVGTEKLDTANWWPQVERCFDGPAPTMTQAGADYQGKWFVALHFATTQAPYVVARKDRSDERDIPWREGTRVRSARRHDLMGLIAAAPWQGQVRAFDGWMKAEPGRWGKGWEFYFEVRLYFRHEGGGPLHMPLALSTIDIRPRGCGPGNAMPLPEVWAASMDDIGRQSTSQIVVERTGTVRIGGHGMLRSNGDLSLPMEIRIVLRTFDGTVIVHANVPLISFPGREDDRSWIPLDRDRWLDARQPFSSSDYAEPPIPPKVVQPLFHYEGWQGVWMRNVPRN